MNILTNRAVSRLPDGAFPLTSGRDYLPAGPGLKAIRRAGPQKDASLFQLVARPGLHEIYAASVQDGPAAIGFALGTVGQILAAKAAEGQAAAGAGPAVCWVRQDWLDREAGRVHAPGLAEFGVSPASVALVRTRDVLSLLRAGLEAARCAGLSAVLIEFQGESRLYDLTASRRLTRAAQAAGVPVLLVRHAASVVASAAETRWRVRPLPSRPMEAGSPGPAAFQATLLRNRNGQEGQDWSMEWNRDTVSFDERALSGAQVGAGQPAAAPPLSGPVVRLSADRAAAVALRLRRAE